MDGVPGRLGMSNEEMKEMRKWAMPCIHPGEENLGRGNIKCKGLGQEYTWCV